MKLELHAHTSETSPCGTVDAKTLIEMYKKKGYDGVVITDHFKKYIFKEKTVDDFLLGYRTAKETGDKIGVKVLLGIELKLVSHSENEYLVYGIDEDFLYNNPTLYELPLQKVRERVNAYGGVVIQAHPYRNGKCEPQDDVDGYEVFNGHYCHHNYNPRAYELALETEKLQTSGSDTHWLCDIGNGGIEVDKIPESRELGKVILKRPIPIKSAMQYIKVAVATSVDALQKAEQEKGISAILCYGFCGKQNGDIPVFSEGEYCEYLPQNRFYICSNQAPPNPFDPSICINGGYGTCNLDKFEIASIEHKKHSFNLCVPENSLTIVEFFGYKPTIIKTEKTA